MRIWQVIAAASLLTSLCVAAAPSAGAIQDGTPGQTETDGQWAGLEPGGV